MPENTKCYECEKTLKSFTVTKDWKGRRLHKKCHKKLLLRLELDRFNMYCLEVSRQ